VDVSRTYHEQATLTAKHLKITCTTTTQTNHILRRSF
jgi:hypothetical protein